MSDIIADIDALIDEQLSMGEPMNGYDYDDPQHPQCPHCHRDWHGLAITQRIEQLRSDWQRAQSGGCMCRICTIIRSELEDGQDALDAATKALDEYRYASDDSEILCPGSDFIGPWATAAQLQKIRDGWPLWSLPDDPFPRRSGFDIATGYLERLMRWTNPTFLGSYQYAQGGVIAEGRGASITYSVLDELPAMRRWVNPWINQSPLIDPAPAEPRPWMWIPRERVFPAYTVEETGAFTVRFGFNRSATEERELRITGTLPELVDATIDTTVPIPWWATDADTVTKALDPRNRAARLTWSNRWGSRDLYVLAPRQYGLGARIAAQSSTWESAELMGPTAEGVRADMARAAEAFRQVREEPPMWAVDPSGRRNARRRR